MPGEGSVEDRLLIRERIAAYSDAVFRADVEAYLDCWMADGRRVGNGQEVRGTPALRDQWSKIWAILESLAFFTEVGAIEVHGDRATARCYCREIMVLKSGGVRKVIGRYDDDLVRDGSTWRFARRTYHLLLDEGRQASA